MRKSLLKSVVAVAVVGATMAMTNVIAMAAMATGTYNIADYDVTKIELDKNGRIPGSTELFDGLKCVKGLNYIDAKEAGVALAASSPEDSTVKLDNVALPSGSTTAGNTWVLSLDKDAEVGVYYTISNSDGLKKSSSAKGTLSVPNATEIVKDSGANKEVLEVILCSCKKCRKWFRNTRCRNFRKGYC